MNIVFPLSIPLFLAIFSTSLTGSAPGDKMKKTGLADSASFIADSKTSVNDNLESISKKESPSGKTYLMKFANAIVILSGLKHLNTSNFLNGS